MTEEMRKQALYKIGASEKDIAALLDYTKNVFQPRRENEGDVLSPNWPEMWGRIQDVCKIAPRLEMFNSVAGIIPVVYPGSAHDFETLLREIVYKDKEIPNIENMGASFVSGKTLRFIILSGKPYSGVPAKDMGLKETDWLEKSSVIRKYHECAHYYTKRFLGSSRNNLHDELIADFCGINAAFGEFRAELFLKFFRMRLDIYTKDLPASAADVIRKLAEWAAKGVEEWTGTNGFTGLDEAGRIEYLAEKEILTYIKN